MHPGIVSSTDTIIDVFLDLCQDVACHPLYHSRDSGQNGGVERPRPRSMPVHRLISEMASGMNLEASSMVDAAHENARGTVTSRAIDEHDMEVSFSARYVCPVNFRLPNFQYLFQVIQSISAYQWERSDLQFGRMPRDL